MTNAEIQVGEYVRTKEGILGIFEGIDEYHRRAFERFEDTIYCVKTQNEEHIRLKYEPKHSFNLIDLIEAGDYVNGTRILAIEESTYTKIGRKAIRILVYRDHRQDCWDTLFEEDIKSIVTKEQFRTMEYKVGGEDD